jgi:hypothetical protein
VSENYNAARSANEPTGCRSSTVQRSNSFRALPTVSEIRLPLPKKTKISPQTGRSRLSLSVVYETDRKALPFAPNNNAAGLDA